MTFDRLKATANVIKMTKDSEKIYKETLNKCLKEMQTHKKTKKMHKTT